MSGKYKKQWNDYFEGGLAMWSHYGFKYHSNLIAKHIIPRLNIPGNGPIVQVGTGLGIAVETLCNIFGSHRVVGYDLFNPLKHPNIKFLDTTKSVPTDKHMAFLEIDVGSMSDARKNREQLLRWAMGNTAHDGCILTNRALVKELQENGRNNFEVIELNSFDIGELWENVYESRLNTKVILRMKRDY
tara:strand:- start:4088 stop:4648 length:561 start_codon:yes stop_codon:yes gene_type:complete